MSKQFYWNVAGMTENDLEGYFRLVEFDDMGISREGMTEDELEDETQSIAHEFDMTEAEARAYVADRVLDDEAVNEALKHFTGENFYHQY